MTAVLKMSTIVLEMRTARRQYDPARILLGKSRAAVLGILYGRPDESFYTRQIARAAGTSVGTVQRELGTLTAAGILSRSVSGHQVYYRANAGCPIFPELKGLLAKTAGLADVLRKAIAPLSRKVRLAFVYGSLAGGTAGARSDVDLMVVGDATFSEVVAALEPAQEQLGREINPTVYPAREFRAKCAAGHHFLKTVLGGPKILLLGGPRELVRLGGSRVAGPA